jgi:methyl-accepting chemotaxis protein
MSVQLALVFCGFIAVLLLLILGIIQLRFQPELRRFAREQYLQICSARADEVGTLIEKIHWQGKMVALRDVIRGTDLEKKKDAILALKGQLSEEIGGITYADEKGDYFNSDGVSGNIADRPYFKEIMEGGKDYTISDAIISKSTGLPIVIIASAIKSPGGETTGLLNATVNLADFSAITNSMKIGKDGYGWIMDHTGQVIAYPSQEMIMNFNIISQSTEKGYQGLEALGKTIQEKEIGEGIYKKPDGARHILYYKRIPNSPGWTLGLSLPVKESDAIVDSLNALMLTLLVLGLLFAVFLSFFSTRAISKSLSHAVKSFEDLSQGEADLTVQFEIKRRDEVGALLSGFNVFMKKLREIMSAMKSSQSDLAGISKELEDSVIGTNSSIERISEKTQTIESQAMAQEESVGQSSSAVEEIAKNIESLDEIITEQAASVTEASASIEQMVGNIGSIKESSDLMAKQFNELSIVAEEGKNIQALAMEKIGAILDRSKTLLEANEVISGIASQTNLLAMNAAIEAAHAGDAGKGFSVVADEIRRLAETSSDQSRAIGDELKQVEEAIAEVVSASKESETAFERVNQRIHETETIVHSVGQALVEQQEGSKQILEALATMNEVTAQVRQGSNEMKAGNHTILKEIQRLKESSQAISGTLKELIKDNAEVSVNSRRVNAMAERTGATIEGMDQVIGRFKV